MPRLTPFLAVVVIGLLCSTLAFRNLTRGEMFAWVSEGEGYGTSRMTNQHAVISYGAAIDPQMLPPPPPPVPLVSSVTQTSELAAGASSSTTSSLRSSPPPPLAADAPLPEPEWMKPEKSFLAFNRHAKVALAPYTPKGTTIHFTFGSFVMMDFVKNWVYFVQKAQLEPFLIGAADASLLKQCDSLGLPAAGIDPDLDVWTYTRRSKSGEVYEMRSEWKYFRHHNSDFLEMGLVKVAFLWELLSQGFHVLISDLDVVWLNGHWQRWMTWAERAGPPVPEAAYIAIADVLVTTDELSARRDAQGGRAGGMHIELNTGVVYFRCTVGALAMVQEWRKSMLAQKGRRDLTENVNDQSLFNQVVRGRALTAPSDLAALVDSFNRSTGDLRHVPRSAFDNLPANHRVVHQTNREFMPCLPTEKCLKASFTFGTLPMRPFTGGHTWFNQNVQEMEGHELPQNEPITVHFTFQFGDTGDYPHGKRQRAREAGLWAVDPPEYFTEGIFIAMDGPPTTPEMQAAVYRRFPEWSPQRHMHMDAPQRQAVRDLLGLAMASDGIVVLPKFYCHCDRYWGFLSKCRFPHVPEMSLPFNCPMDSLYDTQRWNKKGVSFREHTFLHNPIVPESLKRNSVRVRVLPAPALGAATDAQPSVPSNSTHVTLPYGTPMSAVRAAVVAANPDVRVILIANADLRRLCRTLGSAARNREFNKLILYILTESSRYCPQEDMGGYGGPGFDWQNPFTAYNCTWGFHSPAPYPETEGACPATGGGKGAILAERPNSTTCPRQMLCDYNTLPDGRITKPITWCNIEGYNGMRQEYLRLTQPMLQQMPDGRCPYPPGDRPGMPGFDRRGHFVQACPPLTWCT